MAAWDKDRPDPVPQGPTTSQLRANVLARLEAEGQRVVDALGAHPDAAYPVCLCGHRYDHHTDPGDPRRIGCHLCSCAEYAPERAPAA